MSDHRRKRTTNGSSKKEKLKSSHERRSSDTSNHPLLDSRMADDPNQPIIDYSKSVTHMREVPVDDGNPFSDAGGETTTIPSHGRERRASVSLHRTNDPNNSTLGQSSAPLSSSSNSDIDGSGGTNRLKRSPSTPINGYSEKLAKEAQLDMNFVPATPSAISKSPRTSGASSLMQRPSDVADLNAFSDEKNFTKKNVYFNTVNQMQLAVSDMEDRLSQQIAEFSTFQDTQMRAINQRHALLVGLLADVSRGDVIKIDARGNYNGTEHPRTEPCCGCFSFLTGLFDTAAENS